MPSTATLTDLPRRAGKRPPVVRLLMGLWFVLQLVIVGGLPIADAAIEHGPVVAHWEDASHERCPPQHSEADCLLLNTVAAGATLSVVEPIASARLAWVDEVRPTEADQVHRASRIARITTRGPPTA